MSQQESSVFTTTTIPPSYKYLNDEKIYKITSTYVIKSWKKNIKLQYGMDYPLRIRFYWLTIKKNVFVWNIKNRYN